MSANAYPNTAVTTVPVRKLIEYAFRDCGLLAEQQSPQLMDAASLALQYLLQDMSNDGEILFLWEKVLIGGNMNTRQSYLPAGTIDVRWINYINTQNFVANAVVPVGATNAFDFNLDTVYVGTQAALDLGAGVTNIPTYVGFNAFQAQTVTLTVNYSQDGSTWSNFAIFSSQTLSDREWQYYRLDGAPTARFWQVTGFTGTRQIIFGNSNSVIPLSRLNYTDYFALPNQDQNYGGRSLQYWFDRQVNPIINFWPVPSNDFQVFEALLEQQMPDVGNLGSVIPIPNRWLNAVQTGLTAKLALQLPNVPNERVLALSQFAREAMQRARGEERDKSPFYLRPNISYYTR